MTGKEDLLKIPTKTSELKNNLVDALNLETMELLKEENILLKNKLAKYKEENELLKSKLEVYIGALHSEHETIHRTNDLEEILNILKNKKVEIHYLSNCLKQENPIEKQLEYYNCIVHNCYKLTLEEIEILKKWLEVNENENI